MAFDFGVSAKTITRVFGSQLVYKQGAIEEEFPIDIQHNLEVIDQGSGVVQIVTAASFASADFPFSGIKNGDQILEASKTWKVVRRISDDGGMIMVELGK